MLKASDIVMIPYPFTDLQAEKRRPVLVIQSADAYGDFLAMPITSQQGHAEAFSLQDTDLESGRWPKPSWLRIDRLFSLHESRVVRSLGSITPKSFAAIHRALCIRLGCIS